MDRNKEFLLRRQAQLANDKFARSLRDGESAVLDRFGVPIRQGAMIVWRPPYDLIFQVLKAEPLVSLDPRRPVPPGQMTLLLSTGEFPLNVLANMPQVSIIHCGQVATTDGEGLTPAATEDPDPEKDPNHGAH